MAAPGLDDFHYELPPDRIAQTPIEPRDAARMLVVPSQGPFEHRTVRDLPDLLRTGDVLVVNISRVIPARMFGRKARGGGRVEILWIEPASAGGWLALLKARRRPRPGDRILLADGRATAVLAEELGDGMGRLVVDDGVSVEWLMEKEGLTPLPPYIRRPLPTAEALRDRERYQTVYARSPGSVAAPTAGLHFTPELLERIRERGVAIAELTLHVGPGTFRPVKVANPDDHHMHSEPFEIPPETADAIARARACGGRVVAVGTTVVRALESSATYGGRVEAGKGRTDLFIRPPWAFRVADALLTNFHLPRSTLLMLVCAFAGRERILEAYRVAVDAGYRFYSYGDCTFLPGPPLERRP